MTPRTQELLSSFTQKGNQDQTIRVCSKDAKEMLLENFSIIVGGNVRFFQMIHLGEGVHAVKLLPIGWDKEFGTILLAPKTKWKTNEKTLAI